MLERPYRPKWTFFKQYGYVPRSGQLALHKAADYYRYIGFYAYPRAGKSYAAAMEVAATVGVPDYHCWIVAPTYALGAKEFGYIYQAHLETGWLKRAKHATFDAHGGNMRIEYPWGWFVEVKSADRPNLILAEELDELILAEGARIPGSLWERSLYNRIEKRQGRCYIPTTPSGKNWVYDTFYKRSCKKWEGQENNDYDKEFWSCRVTHIKEEGDVPGCVYQGGVYTQETIDRARRQMSPILFREQFGGDFVSYAGLVYPHDPDKLYCEPFSIPSEWRRVVGYDHGASGRQGGMTAIPFIAWDNRKPRHCYVYDLVYRAGHGAAYYAEQIRRRLVQDDLTTPLTYDAIVIDPSAKQVRIELSLLGLLTTTPYARAFEDRYTTVVNLIEEGRLHIFRNEALKPWRYEIERYEWKEGMKGEPRGDSVTGPDDAMDATGYALLHRVPPPGDEEVVNTAKDSSTPIKLDPLSERHWRQWRARRREDDEIRRDEEAEDTTDVSEGIFDDVGYKANGEVVEEW